MGNVDSRDVAPVSAPRTPKERPILFSSSMIKALLDGRKTVTRRLVRAREGHRIDVTKDGAPVYVTGAPDDGGTPIACPYGAPGDRLWVRETWRRSANALGADACGGAMGSSFAGPEFEYCASSQWPRMGGPWKPSIHMPRRASRLTLEVVGARVERLHDITGDDVFAEGLDMNAAGTFYVDVQEDDFTEFAEPRDAFAFLWDGINGRRAAWESNPHVWRVEFALLPQSGASS